MRFARTFGTVDYHELKFHFLRDYAFYENGEKILKEHRLVFRQRTDLQNVFENPFDDSCYHWMRANLGKLNVKTFMLTYYSTYIASKLTFGNTRMKFKNRVRIYRSLISQINNVIMYG